jgi:hypothetical protein
MKKKIATIEHRYFSFIYLSYLQISVFCPELVTSTPEASASPGRISTTKVHGSIDAVAGNIPVNSGEFIGLVRKPTSFRRDEAKTIQYKASSWIYQFWLYSFRLSTNQPAPSSNYGSASPTRKSGLLSASKTS